MRGKFSLLFVTALLCIFTGCQCAKKPTGPKPESDPPIPVANAGPDRTCQVGQFVYLDGTDSEPGKGNTVYLWDWQNLPGNPYDVFVCGDSLAWAGFTIEGTYRFTLTLHCSKTYGVFTSEPDTVEVIITPRGQSPFEDPALEVHARWWLKKPTGDLTQTNLLNLDTLTMNYISVENIKSLNGLENCPNLCFLNFIFQSLTDLTPLSNLTNLKWLSISQNYILTDISPLSGLTELIHLDLMANWISDMTPLENLTRLEYLDISENPIEDITIVSNITELKFLSFYGIQNGDISCLSGLIKLTQLWLGNCKIEDINPLENLTNLNLLCLLYNNITDITALEKLENLERLHLEENKIQNILPLVNNNGIGEGDILTLWDNPLNSQSINEYIPMLENRGVYVYW